MNEVAKSGARRFTTGMATNPAISRPAAKIVAGMARSEPRHRRLVVMAERHQREIFAPEEIGVGDEEDHKAEADKRTSGSANALTRSTSPGISATCRASGRTAAAGRGDRQGSACAPTASAMSSSEEAHEERRHRSNEESEPDQQANPGKDVEGRVQPRPREPTVRQQPWIATQRATSSAIVSAKDFHSTPRNGGERMSAGQARRSSSSSRRPSGQPQMGDRPRPEAALGKRVHLPIRAPIR